MLRFLLLSCCLRTAYAYDEKPLYYAHVNKMLHDLACAAVTISGGDHLKLITLKCANLKKKSPPRERTSPPPREKGLKDILGASGAFTAVMPAPPTPETTHGISEADTTSIKAACTAETIDPFLEQEEFTHKLTQRIDACTTAVATRKGSATALTSEEQTIVKNAVASFRSDINTIETKSTKANLHSKTEQLSREAGLASQPAIPTKTPQQSTGTPLNPAKGKEPLTHEYLPDPNQPLPEREDDNPYTVAEVGDYLKALYELIKVTTQASGYVWSEQQRDAVLKRTQSARAILNDGLNQLNQDTPRLTELADAIDALMAPPEKKMPVSGTGHGLPLIYPSTPAPSSEPSGQKFPFFDTKGGTGEKNIRNYLDQLSKSADTITTWSPEDTKSFTAALDDLKPKIAKLTGIDPDTRVAFFKEINKLRDIPTRPESNLFAQVAPLKKKRVEPPARTK